MDYYDRYSRFREDGNIKIVPFKIKQIWTTTIDTADLGKMEI